MRWWFIGLGVAGAAAVLAAAASSSSEPIRVGGAKPKQPGGKDWSGGGPKAGTIGDLARPWEPWVNRGFKWSGEVVAIDTGKDLVPAIPPIVGVAAAAIPVAGQLIGVFTALWNTIAKAAPNKKHWTTTPGELQGVATWTHAGAIELEAVIHWGERHGKDSSPPCAKQEYAASADATGEALELPLQQTDWDYPEKTPGGMVPAQNDEGICQHHDLSDLSGNWINPAGPQEPRLYLIRVGNTWTLTVWLPGRGWSWWLSVRYRWRPGAPI